MPKLESRREGLPDPERGTPRVGRDKGDTGVATRTERHFSLSRVGAWPRPPPGPVATHGSPGGGAGPPRADGETEAQGRRRRACKSILNATRVFGRCPQGRSGWRRDRGERRLCSVLVGLGRQAAIGPPEWDRVGCRRPARLPPAPAPDPVRGRRAKRAERPGSLSHDGADGLTPRLRGGDLAQCHAAAVGIVRSLRELARVAGDRRSHRALAGPAQKPTHQQDTGGPRDDAVPCTGRKIERISQLSRGPSLALWGVWGIPQLSGGEEGGGGREGPADRWPQGQQQIREPLSPWRAPGRPC